MSAFPSTWLARVLRLGCVLLWCFAVIPPSIGMDAYQPVEVYLRLAPLPANGVPDKSTHCERLLPLFGQQVTPQCRTVHAGQGLLSLRWARALPEHVSPQMQALQSQGHVQWFEIRQSGLKTQAVNRGSTAVVVDPAFWTALQPSAPAAGEPWYVSDDLRRLRAWNSMMEVQGQIVVAVIDSGVNFQDPALATLRWQNTREIAGNGVDDDGNGYVDDVSGWDFVNEGYAQLFDDINEPDNDPADALGHGTAVAGIISAVVGSELSARVRLMPLRVAYGLGSSGSVNPAALAEAIFYAADNGAHILNISLGGVQRYEVVAEAIRYVLGKGVAVVAAAGNSGAAPMFPANEPGVLSVGALDRNNAVLASSAKGDGVDLYASGVDMLAASGTVNTLQDNGTSFAAPVVSASLALLQAVHTGTDALCQAQRLAALDQMPAGGQMADWLAFQLQRSERSRQTAGGPAAWQQGAVLCGAPAASLSSLVRNS